jgi:hypothetical protein
MNECRECASTISVLKEVGKKIKIKRFSSGELYFIFLSFVLRRGFFSPTITNKTPRGKPKELEME